MKFEFSAGGVVYKRVPTKNETNDILILLGQHSQHHGWVFPKGLIGDQIENESKEDTAIREVKEETGIDAEILEPLSPVTYWYEFAGEKRKKTVYYYLMQYLSGNSNKRDMELENIAWLSLEAVEKRLTYPSDKQVWEEAKKRILHTG